jgi:hypothetical protein
VAPATVAAGRCELGSVATVARGVNSARSLLVCGAQQPVTSAC